MGLSDFIKTVKKIFTGDDGEYEDDYRFKDSDEYEETYDIDSSSDDDDDEIGGVSEAESNRFQKALERFYMKLPEKERDSEDIDELIDEVTERFFARKISDPTKALEQAYQRLKATKVQRTEQKNKASSVIVEKLQHYDELSEEERNQLTDWNGKYSINKIKKKDLKAVAEIVQSWLEPQNLQEETIDKISHLDMESDLMDELATLVKVPIIGVEEVQINELNYHHQLFLFNNRYRDLLRRKFFHFSGDNMRINSDTLYEDYADFFKRYYLESGENPQPINCDELIVNRPCYLKKPLTLYTPHFHMGKRYFERDSWQEITVYLFADALEFIADRGHYKIYLSDIIDISKNKWDGEDKWDGEEDCSEPELIEITCRDNHKWLFSYGYETNDGDLLVLWALIYFFIKKPQNSEIKKEDPVRIESAKQEPIQQEPVQQEAVKEETIQQEVNSDSKIFFKPWVGRDYNTGGVFGKKVLVLGESHYGDATDATDETIGVVKEFVYEYWGAPYQQTFLCFERALAGRELNQEEREQLWNSVMFYNYFQKSTTGPRTEPDMTAQKESEEAFRELLEHYQPDVIIVWGQRLYNLLPGWDGTETTIKVDNDSTRVWHYNIKGKTIPAMSVHHPSAPTGKDWTYWHQFHKSFIGEPQFN